MTNAKSDKLVVLLVTEVKYYSPADKAAFLKWFGDLPCVKKIEGHLQALYINIDASAIDEDCLREILAIFKRYRVPLKQLSILNREYFTYWSRENKRDIERLR